MPHIPPPLVPLKETPSKKNPKNKLTDIPQSKPPKFLVISGGEGYEDFRTNSMTEGAGREDSTNHVLLWTI